MRDKFINLSSVGTALEKLHSFLIALRVRATLPMNIRQPVLDIEIESPPMNLPSVKGDKAAVTSPTS